MKVSVVRRFVVIQSSPQTNIIVEIMLAYFDES